MKVRYNPVFAVIMLLAAAFIGGTGLLIGKLLLMGLGALHLLVGILYLTQPWFEVYDDRLELRNLVGMTVRTHSVGLRQLEFVDGKLQPRGGGKPRLGGFLANAADLKEVAAAAANKRSVASA